MSQNCGAIHVCVLAAGTSKRFGTTKLIQDYRGRPLLTYALAASQEACPGSVTLVVGHDSQRVVSAADGFCDKVAINDRYSQGIGTSIATGVSASRDDAKAIVVVLADQPLITGAHIRTLIETWSGADNEIVASSFDDVDCPPILFPISAFDVLCTLSGDNGAKSILASDAFVVRRIGSPMSRFDIDTPDDMLLHNDIDEE